MGTVKDNRLNKITAIMKTTTPTQDFRSNFQSKVESEFDYASDVYDIERYNRDTATWETVTVRLTFPYRLGEQSTIKDDYREILFKDTFITPLMGDLYNFNDYYYMCVDTGRLETPTNSCIVQRCNIELRFTASTPLSEDIISVYGISKSKLLNVNHKEYMDIADGTMEVLVTNDTNAQSIRRSPQPTRFLLGNQDWEGLYQVWVVEDIDAITYVRRTYGATTPSSSNGMIKIKLKLSQTNDEKDDHTNQVAWQDWFSSIV